MNRNTWLRDALGRFRARGPIEALPAVYDRYGAIDIPKGAERLRLGLFIVTDVLDYVRTHLPEPRYRDFLGGVRDGTTDRNLPLL